ncbi:unnamed protein product [Effrenium voratum]|uniref:Uncharacterized protein n=1 Tax=Effrenium voratum TaxID=2562239 RepID=A0AA36J7R3_9DINO|nr:unnamed protein product [Effrenium voratum]CAJ1429869.1 unnamed protein product [Effrenium voratum]
MITRWLFVFAVRVCCAQSPGFSGVWHYVDARAVVCPGGPGRFSIPMEKPTGFDNLPHIFTVFRTTNGAVSLGFVARDAAGRMVTDQSGGLNLQPQGYRRLQGSDASAEAGEVGVRKLLFSPRRRYSSPRRRYTDSRRRAPTTSSPRRRMTDERRRYMSSPRRRYMDSAPRRRYMDSAPRRRYYDPSPRRRAATMETPRRRAYSSGRRRRSSFSTYTNPYSPSIGQYGYSPAYATHNYGGHMPMTTPYGYSGANAYQGSSGSAMKIALAGGAGLLAGYAASHFMNGGGSNQYQWGGYDQQQLLNAPCTSGSWSGMCNNCVSQFGPSSCVASLTPKFDATRDDLMSTGFIPAQVAWPLQVEVTQIYGQDFNPALICQPPPPGVAPPPMKQLFLTLTALPPPGAGPGTPPNGYQNGPGYAPPGPGYAPPGYQNYGEPSSGGVAGAFASAMSSLVACCCCCGLCAFCFFQSKKKPSYGNPSDSSDDEGMELAHHSPNPYWDAGTHAQGGGRGFMGTLAPNGKAWSEYCVGQPELGTGMVLGPWGECLAWAVAYEHRSPEWHKDPQYREMGPVGSVIQAMMEKASDQMAPKVQAAAEELEVYCREAAEQGRPLPVINQEV